jgi:hypothetical protein
MNELCSTPKEKSTREREIEADSHCNCMNDLSTKDSQFKCPLTFFVL